MVREKRIEGNAERRVWAIKEQKEALRKEKLCLRRQLTPEERLGKSGQIAGSVLRLPLIQEAESVLCYASYRDEVRTQELIADLLELGKRVYLPKAIEDGQRRMDFFEVRAGERLTEGYCHIPEPSDSSERFCLTESGRAAGEKKTAVLLPGSVFDRKGSRIGYGGGYYDRYLQRMEKAGIPFGTAGLCFACQMAESVPQETTDRPVGLVVTEAEAYLGTGL